MKSLLKLSWAWVIWMRTSSFKMTRQLGEFTTISMEVELTDRFCLFTTICPRLQKKGRTDYSARETWETAWSVASYWCRSASQNLFKPSASSWVPTLATTQLKRAKLRKSKPYPGLGIFQSTPLRGLIVQQPKEWAQMAKRLPSSSTI